MAIKLTKLQIANIKWMEWTTHATKEVTAHAVDPTSKARTGKVRALSGALVPETAKPAGRTTKKDHFDKQILETLKAKAAE